LWNWSSAADGVCGCNEATRLMARLAGKVALITGTAGGQGAAAARLFASEGATVCGCDLDAERAESVAKEIREGGGEMYSTAPVDLADPLAAASWVDEAAALAGGIDVLYNNASAPRVGPFEQMTWDDWQFTIHNELDLIFTVTKAAWPHLVARGGGVVINTASVSAHRGATFIEQSAHGAAKGGVLAMTRHLAASGARHGIRANSISPGLIVTPQIEPFLDEPGHPVHELLHSHPLGRLGEPRDVAAVALFLACDEAAYLNAVDIIVDGGQSLIS
jgi:meso-butanediol dehydrogenase/(S,S)-butanediol dehydrogenase/diacetyl reductase